MYKNIPLSMNRNTNKIFSKSVTSLALKSVIIKPIILLLFIFSSIGNSQPHYNKSNSRPFRFIFSVNLFHNQKLEDAKASTTILMNKIKKDKNIKEDFEIIVCNTEKEILDEIKTDFDFLLVTAVEMAAIKKSGRAKPLLINETQNSYGFIYYLITNKGDNYNKISELSKGNISILARSPNQVPSLWLDKILRDNKLPKKESYFNDITYDYKATNIVLSVFFKKIAASIVSKASYDLLCELNPRISKQIKVIEISDPLLFGVIFFDTRNKDKEREKLVYDTLLSLDKDAYGRQLLDMFNVDRIVPFKDEYWQNFLKLYK
ncbi:MAG TPA: PhnD/SsuA/transferrin family substrate-binding protein [Ignavibacteriaceae bacterium]|nr:PhnD/SsuA/transferrin family substrate-binding protein [Ignavibacteriaceae bacterium]